MSAPASVLATGLPSVGDQARIRVTELARHSIFRCHRASARSRAPADHAKSIASFADRRSVAPACGEERECECGTGQGVRATAYDLTRPPLGDSGLGSRPRVRCLWFSEVSVPLCDQHVAYEPIARWLRFTRPGLGWEERAASPSFLLSLTSLIPQRPVGRNRGPLATTPRPDTTRARRREADRSGLAGGQCCSGLASHQAGRRGLRHGFDVVLTLMARFRSGFREVLRSRLIGDCST
jgi:hypothetical protein